MNWLRLTIAHVSRTRAEWFAALGCLAGVIAIASWQGFGLGAALALIGLFVGGFLSIVIHELGHAFAAWAVGWRVWIISALPVSVRLGHAPRFTTALTQDVGGFVLGSPPTAALETRWRSIVFSAGGPLASLITGPLFIYWLTTFPPGMWESQHMAGVLAALLALAFHSSMSAAYTLWPLKFGDGRPNDMGMILAALFAPTPPQRERALLWAEALFEYGVEPSAWPEWIRESVEAAAQAADASPQALALGFAMAVDRRDLGLARRIAQSSDGEIAKVLRAYLRAEAGDADGADDELAAVEDRDKIESVRHWRTLTLVRAQALAGSHASARRALATLADELGASPVPQPFWETQLAHTDAALEKL